MGPRAIFLDFSASELERQAGRIGVCLECLPETEIWSRAGDNSNAVGNLVLHLCGNVRQWILMGVGRQPGIRERDDEFTASSGDGLAERLDATVAEACRVIRALPARRLTEKVTIQGDQVTVLEAIYHVVQHFSGHAGQIFLLTKRATGEYLDFYPQLGRSQRERTP